MRKTGETLARWGRTCHLCRQPGATTADHLIPRSKGGTDDVEHNLRPAHHGCNTVRGDRDLSEWFAKHPVPHRPALTPSREW
jgi:5-methylcytosine-specific restriction endonuclease McrA